MSSKVAAWRKRPPVEPLGQRAIVAQAAFALIVIAAVLALISDIDQLDIIQRFSEGGLVRQAELDDFTDSAVTAALVYLAVVIITAIAFLLWWGRAYRNVVALGVKDPRFGRRWAIWYWFIPFIAFFRPKQVSNDIWRASDPELDGRASGWRFGRVPALMHFWWAAWIGSGLTSVLAQRFTASASDNVFSPDFDLLGTAAVLYIASDVLDVIGAILAVLFIRRLTRRQSLRIERFERGEVSGGEPDASPGDIWAPSPTA